MRAREHELRLMEGLREARSWSRWEDREWLAWAAAEAKVSREDTEARVAQGRALLARVQPLIPGLELGPGRCGIARCACGSSWPVLARQVHGTLPGVLAHELGVLICPSCGRTASLDATPAPVTDYDREG